jgi:hypothetical protein
MQILRKTVIAISMLIFAAPPRIFGQRSASYFPRYAAPRDGFEVPDLVQGVMASPTTAEPFR